MKLSYYSELVAFKSKHFCSSAKKIFEHLLACSHFVCELTLGFLWFPQLFLLARNVGTSPRFSHSFSASIISICFHASCVSTLLISVVMFVSHQNPDGLLFTVRQTTLECMCRWMYVMSECIVCFVNVCIACMSNIKKHIQNTQSYQECTSKCRILGEATA